MWVTSPGWESKCDIKGGFSKCSKSLYFSILGLGKHYSLSCVSVSVTITMDHICLDALQKYSTKQPSLKKFRTVLN